MPQEPVSITPALARRIEIWPVDHLVPYGRNARTHSREQVAQIAASVAEYGLDLKAIEKRYPPYLEGVSSRDDLDYLFEEMLGEITMATCSSAEETSLKRKR